MNAQRSIVPFLVRHCDPFLVWVAAFFQANGQRTVAIRRPSARPTHTAPHTFDFQLSAKSDLLPVHALEKKTPSESDRRAAREHQGFRQFLLCHPHFPHRRQALRHTGCTVIGNADDQFHRACARLLYCSARCLCWSRSSSSEWTIVTNDS